MHTFGVQLLRTFVFSGFLLLMIASQLFGQRTGPEKYKGRDVATGEIIVKFRGANITQSRALAVQDTDITSTQQVGQRGAILVRSRGRNVEALLQAYASRLDVEYAEPNYLLHVQFAFGIPGWVDQSNRDAAAEWIPLLWPERRSRRHDRGRTNHSAHANDIRSRRDGRPMDHLAGVVE